MAKGSGKDYRQKKSRKDDKFYIYGKHPVLEALKNPKRKVIKLFCSKNAMNFLYENIQEEAINKIPKEIIRPDEIDKILPSKAADITHQGFLLETKPLEQPSIKSLANQDLIIACNKVTDPHNIGAIIRNGLAFNAAAVITDERNSPPENATIAKTSAGCIEKIPYIRDKSLANIIKFFKSEGFLIVGLDGSGEININELVKNLRDEKILLIVGSEGKGMSQNIIEACDHVTKINISDKAESLNASVASAIALYALSNR